MRSALVYVREKPAAQLTQHDDGSMELTYLEEYLNLADATDISLTLPMRPEPYRSENLFPFFFNLLPEGSNKRTLCYLHRIEKDDYFSILLQVAGADTIGAVLVVPASTNQSDDE